MYTRTGAIFSIKDSKRFQDLGFYLSRHGLIQNFTDEADQLMRGDAPWHGPWEKHQSFYQMLIEAFTKEGDIVMDWQASTCNSYSFIVAIQSCFKHPRIVVNASHVLSISLILLLGTTIHACRSSGRHIVALEHDANIFKEVLMPMRDPKPLPIRSTPHSRAPIPDKPLQKRERLLPLCKRKLYFV